MSYPRAGFSHNAPQLHAGLFGPCLSSRSRFDFPVVVCDLCFYGVILPRKDLHIYNDVAGVKVTYLSEVKSELIHRLVARDGEN